MDTLQRNELHARWEQIFWLSEEHPGVRKYLLDMALGKVKCSRYQRYVASTNIAGFGKLSGIGPNRLQKQNLGWYIDFQSKTPVPPHKKRKLKLEKALENLSVSTPFTNVNGLKFQEILWIVINKYNLDFEITDGPTFFVFSPSLRL